MNLAHWLPFHLEIRLVSPWSWLERRRGTTEAGTVAGLHHLESHVAIHTSGRRDLNTVVSAGEREWKSSQQCSWPHLYLVLSQLKKIERYEAVMLFYPFIRCIEQWFQTLLFDFLKNLLCHFSCFSTQLKSFLFIKILFIFYSSLICRTWVLWFLCFPRGKKSCQIESCPCFLPVEPSVCQYIKLIFI